MIVHPKEDKSIHALNIAHRMKGDKWQYWSSVTEQWVWDMTESYGPDPLYKDPTLYYEDTWCEPEEDDG